MEQDLSATPVSDPTVTSQFDAWAIGNTIFHWKHKESELEFSGDIDAFNFYLKSKIQSGELIVSPKPVVDESAPEPTVDTGTANVENAQPQ